MNELKELTSNYEIFSISIFYIFCFIFFLEKFIKAITFLAEKWGIKTKKITEKEELYERINKLEKHDKWQYDEILKISNGIVDIKELILEKEKQDNAQTVAVLRTQLWDMHSKLVKQQYVNVSDLKTFTELGKFYESKGGNDIYHDKLYPEIMSLEIR